MKGPGLRLDLDVRRVWECPACGRVSKTSGGVTRLDCDCRGEKSPSMRLVERRRRTESPFDHAAYAAQKRLDAAMGRLPPEPDESGPAEDAGRPDGSGLADAIPQQPVPLATSEMADEPAVRDALTSEPPPPLPASVPDENVLTAGMSEAVDPAGVTDPGPGPSGV